MHADACTPCLVGSFDEALAPTACGWHPASQPLWCCRCSLLPFLDGLQIKEEEAERERQQDVRYMQQQAAQLDKQERERQQLLERVRAVQVSCWETSCCACTAE